MGVETILFNYIQNPEVETYFILITISMISGLVGLYVRYFIVQKGDKNWIELNTFDKLVLGIVTGSISGMLFSFVIFIYLLSTFILSLVSSIEMKIVSDKELWMAFFGGSLVQNIMIALREKRSVKGFNYLSKYFRPSNLAISGWVIFVMLFLVVGAASRDIPQLILGGVLATLSAIYLFNYLIPGLDKKKEK